MSKRSYSKDLGGGAPLLSSCSGFLGFTTLKNRFGKGLCRFVYNEKNIEDESENLREHDRFLSNAKGESEKAFTLAEVLITLGIIGVVAAMTLPAIITKYQKKATVAKVKKFYTNFNQAIKLSEAKNGDFKYWNAESSEELYDKFIAPYLKVVQVQKNIHMYGYFTQGVKFIFSDGTQAICAISTNMIGYGNGAQIYPCIFFTHGVSTWHSSVGDSDTNYTGTRDTFWFLINEENGILEPPHMDQTRDYNISSCKTASATTKNGYTDCGTLLYKDGWEIKDDYPW